ncbi:MAG: hypothetical protein ACTHOB_00180 [Ginsengibacter sp.]
MKIKHLLPVAFAVVLASCSTAYRSGQTPDDVYYSPAPEQPTYKTSDKSSDYVTTENEQDRNSYNYRNDEENEIRAGIQNPIYRNSITFGMGYGGYIPYSFSLFGGSPYYGGYDPFTPYVYNPYGYNPYAYSPYKSFVYNDMVFASPYYNYGYSPYGFNSFYNPYSIGYSPFFYSGYYPGIYSPAYKTINTNTGVRRYNLNAYNNNSGSGATRGTPAQPVRTVTTQPNNGSVPVRSTTGTTQPTRGTGVGNVIRRVFTPSNRTYTNPNSTRTYNNNNTRVYNNDNTRTYNNDNSRSYTPERSYQPSAPSSSSSSGSSSGSAPVRTFRR